MKTLLTLFLVLAYFGLSIPAYGDDDDNGASTTTSGNSDPSPSADEAVSRSLNSVSNDLVFDPNDASAPVFSKSDETFRGPSSLADREKAQFNR